MIMFGVRSSRVWVVLAAAMLVREAAAGTSANYTLSQETVDTGGGRGISASYAVDAASSAGGSAASTASTASGAYAARLGFAGQLFEPLSLFLAATPNTVAEGATRQISAFLVQDESVLVPQAPSSLTWSLVSGPLASITSSGLATGGPVYQTTTATLRGTLGSLGATLDLQVLNTQTDNFGAYAGDGLDDAWQVEFFGLNNPAASPAVDADHDGQINRFEFDAGLSPIDPTSRFLIAFAPVRSQPLAVGILFSPRLPDRTYTVYSSPTPDRTTATPIIPGTIIDNGDQRIVSDPNPGSQRKFYHILITRP